MTAKIRTADPAQRACGAREAPRTRDVLYADRQVAQEGGGSALDRTLRNLEAAVHDGRARLTG